MNMTVEELCIALDASVYAAGDRERKISKAVAGDLLSFVMGTAPEGAIWVTIQVHLNVAAVAVLKDLPVIIIAAGRRPQDDLVERCQQEGICLASVKDTIYAVCAKLAALGFGE